MRLKDTGSWQIRVGAGSPLIDCALWIRAAERLQIPADPLVPGPLDLDRPPAPISTADEVIAEQWLGWWRSLVAPRQFSGLHDPSTQPAADSPDPLGLAPYPLLAAIVTCRWPEVLRWHTDRRPAEGVNISQVVRDLERSMGRRVRPFALDFVLLPVRDKVIRRVDDEHYLVPEGVYRGPDWVPWLRDLVSRLG